MTFRLPSLFFLLTFFYSLGLAQGAKADVPMSTRMALSELKAIVESSLDLNKLYAGTSGQFPVARMNGRLMVGFVGRLHDGGTVTGAFAGLGEEVKMGGATRRCRVFSCGHSPFGQAGRFGFEWMADGVESCS